MRDFLRQAMQRAVEDIIVGQIAFTERSLLREVVDCGECLCLSSAIVLCRLHGSIASLVEIRSTEFAALAHWHATREVPV